MAVHLFVMPILAIVGWCGAVFAPRLDLPTHCARLWGRFAVAAGGIKLRLIGAEVLLSHRPAVLVANHSSAFDIFAMMAAVPIPLRFVAKRELFSIPLLGPAMRRAGHVPLQRSGSPRDVRSLDNLDRVVAQRAAVIFFPEGSRQPDGRLGSFRSGAFYFAQKGDLPVIPVAIVGAQRVQPAFGWRVFPGLIEIRVQNPIPSAGIEREELRERVHAALAAALPEEQRPPR